MNLRKKHLKMRKVCNDYFVNLGTSKDIPIKKLSHIIKNIVGFKSEIVWDITKQDSTLRKLLDVSKINQLGLQAKIELEKV